MVYKTPPFVGGGGVGGRGHKPYLSSGLEYFCKSFVKISAMHTMAINVKYLIFPHYKSMATISGPSNQSSYPTETRTVLFVPPAYICYKNRLNVDHDGRTTTTDNRCLHILLARLLYEPSSSGELITVEFHFSDIHLSMNAMSLILYETHCVHTSMNVRKMKLIS